MNKDRDSNTKTGELDKKVKLPEKQDRKYNVLFYGTEEEAHENIYDTFGDSLMKDLGVDVERERTMYLAHGHRLLFSSPGPKPIILRFTSFADRELIL